MRDGRLTNAWGINNIGGTGINDETRCLGPRASEMSVEGRTIFYLYFASFQQ